MALLFAMLPVYIFGNLHCFGMCGPLAMLLARSPFRLFYLLGRLVSFTMAGVIAGAIGEVVGAFFNEYYLSGAFSLLVGGSLLFVAALCLFQGHLPGKEKLGRLLGPFEDRLQRLVLQDMPWPLFLFGFLTILLPCGQTLLVFSACALSGSASIGALNGFAFGLLTTPSLFLAMQARHLIANLRTWYLPMAALSIALLGGLFALRGLADFGLISHLSFHSLVLY